MILFMEMNPLIDAISTTVSEETHDNQLFFAYLGADALKNPPPLGFSVSF